MGCFAARRIDCVLPLRTLAVATLLATLALVMLNFATCSPSPFGR